MAELFHRYFHEDWAIDGDTTWDVIDEFIRDEPELAGCLPAEIDEVLAPEATEEHLQRLVHDELICSYRPTIDGLTYRAWLSAIAARAGRPPVDHQGSATKELAALDHLFGLYLHQDWALDDDSPWDVVDQFVRQEPRLAAGLPTEVDEVLSRQSTEEQLWNLVHRELRCSYLPTVDGWTYREWLTAVADRVKRATAA